MVYKKEEILYNQTFVTDVKRKYSKNIRINFDAQTPVSYNGSWKPSATQDISGGGNARTKQVLNFPTSVVTENGYTMNGSGSQVLITNQQTALVSFNFASTVLTVANRLLGAAQLQYSTDGEEWSDIEGTLVYNYNRGIQTSGGAAAFGSIYEGTGGASVLHDFATNSYLRARFWIEGRSNSSSGLRTELEGCRLSISSVTTPKSTNTNDFLSNNESVSVFNVDSGVSISDGDTLNNNIVAKHAFMIATSNLKLNNVLGYVNSYNSSSCEEDNSFAISFWKKLSTKSGTSATAVSLLYTQTYSVPASSSDSYVLIADTTTSPVTFNNSLQINEGEGIICTVKRVSGTCGSIYADLEIVFEEINPTFPSVDSIETDNNGIVKKELTMPALCFTERGEEKVCK